MCLGFDTLLLVAVINNNNNYTRNIHDSQDLVKDFGRTARSWKGKLNQAIRKKIYKLKKIELYKETKQNYNN